MAVLLIVIFLGAFAGGGLAYLQAYFAENDPPAGAWMSGAAFFLGSAALIAWLLLDPDGILAPSFIVAAALAYLITQIVMARRTPPATRGLPEDRRDVGAA